jgi:hypothetical protein
MDNNNFDSLLTKARQMQKEQEFQISAHLSHENDLEVKKGVLRGIKRTVGLIERERKRQNLK